MSLINDQQKKNAGVKEPTIKPPKASALPELLPDTTMPTEEAAPEVEAASFSAMPQQVQPTQALPVSPEGLEPVVEEAQAPQVPSIDLLPIAPVEIERAPDKTILETAPIWRDTSAEFGTGARLKPEVSNTTLPSFSVQTPDNSAILNQAFEGTNRAISGFNSAAQQEAYAAAQRAQATVSKRGSLPNTPDATKKWHSAPLGFLGDVFFGTEQARKQSEAGIANPLTGSFGRAGAGIGGAFNYALNLIPSFAVAADAEILKFRANTLEKLGLDKKDAQRFAQNGIFEFLPSSTGSGYSGVGTGKLNQSGGLNLGALKPSNILNFDFESANKKNLLLDAIAGDPLTDVNEPPGSVKYGRVYTRTQRKEGSSPVSDPVGFALQIGTYLFSPGEIPGDRLVSYGVGKLFNAFKKPASKAIGQVTQGALVRTSDPLKAQVDDLSERAGRARVATAKRQFFAEQPPKAPDNFGFDLSQITEEQARRLNTGTPRLGQAEIPERLALPPQQNVWDDTAGVEFAAPDAPDLPRLDVGEAVLEYPTAANKPTGALPQQVPRAYLGSGEVTRAALPPAFDPTDVPDISVPLLPYSSPAKVALDLGLGNPGFRLEKAGALALRPLSQVVEELKAVEPKLLEGFDGITWEEFKLHISEKLPDIGQVSTVGEDLAQVAGAQTLAPIKTYTDVLKTIGANSEDGFDLSEIASILQETAALKKLTNAELQAQLEELLPEATKKFNSGYRVDATSTAIVKQSTDEEVLESGLDLAKLKQRIGAAGLVLRGDETASELDVVASELSKIKNTPRLKDILQRQIDGREIAIYSSLEDAPRLSEQNLLEYFKSKPTASPLKDNLTTAAELTDKFIAARTLKGEEQIDASFNFSVAQKELLKGRGDELSNFYLREIFDTSEAKEVIRRKLDSLLSNKEVLEEMTDLVVKSFKYDEEAREALTLLMRDNLKGKKDAYNKFRTGEFWQEPEIKTLVQDKFNELLTVPKKPTPLSTDDLLTAAEELAQHKLALDLPLEKLDSLFDETVDFGRKPTEDLSFDLLDTDFALSTINNGGIVKLTPRIFDNAGDKLTRTLAQAWQAGDYETIVELGRKTGRSFEDSLADVVQRNNDYIQAANKVRNVPAPAEALTKVGGKLYHGTALDSWQPPSNLYVNGSRGELGGGTYFALDKQIATDYAKARVGENVSAKTMDTDLNPTVAEVESLFASTLDARKPLDKNLLKGVFADLPEEVRKPLLSSINRKKKPLSYVQMRALMEESFVKAGVEPTEEFLQQTDADISKNLRALGFDSVLDNESGFVLSLDNSRVGSVVLENVQSPSAIEAATARYNADSYTAKAYPELLSSDANLRDSTYKVLSQTQAALNKKLAEVQDEILKRGLPEQDTILPNVTPESSRPKSFVEALDELTPEAGICDL